MLDTHRLRVFRAVVATGSVNGAATSLGYTPSAISQHVAALQRETGLTLVERRGRGIEPTEVGRRLASEAGEVLERLSALDLVVGDLREGRIGRLTVHYIGSVGAAWMPPVVAALSRELPELRLDLRLVELAGDDTPVPDVAIEVEHPGATDVLDGRDRQVLVEEPHLVVVPEGHRHARAAEVSLAELRDEAWIDNDIARGPCRQIVLDACDAAGFVPTFGVQAHDYPTALAFVAAGLGVTVLPRLGASALPPEVVAVPIAEPGPRRRIVLRTKAAVTDHPAVRRMTTLLRAQAQGGGPAGRSSSGAGGGVSGGGVAGGEVSDGGVDRLPPFQRS